MRPSKHDYTTDHHTFRADPVSHSVKRILIIAGLVLILFGLAMVSKSKSQARLSTTPDRAMPSEGGLTYHPVEVYVLAQGGNRHTHVKTTGYRVMIRQEADGDIHVRTCDDAGTKGMDRTHCIVIECIPEIPCGINANDKTLIGTLWTACGNWRFDPEVGHKWNEIHPWRPCAGPSPSKSVNPPKVRKHDQTQSPPTAATPARH
jgi:hypothetical protein